VSLQASRVGLRSWKRVSLAKYQI